MSEHNISIGVIGREHLDSLTACYRQVYGGASAWREFRCCPICNRLWSIQEWASYISERQTKGLYIDHCLCGGHIVDRWPVEEVRQYILDEAIERPHMVSVALFDDDNLIGFIWGYNVGVDEIESQKNIPDFTASVRRKFGDVTHVFYQSEMGVLQPYQRCGFGKLLFWARLCLALDFGYSIGVLRTNESAGSYHMMTKYGGYEHLTSYPLPGVEPRIILGANLQEVRNVFYRKDPDLRSRLLSVTLQENLSKIMERSN
ncbi:hypothetical protein KKE14_01895 [Patescibacteria group bacterium]|nr:hypothetical protein [Patescibacteria group bacterium]